MRLLFNDLCKSAHSSPVDPRSKPRSLLAQRQRRFLPSERTFSPSWSLIASPTGDQIFRQALEEHFSCRALIFRFYVRLPPRPSSALDSGPPSKALPARLAQLSSSRNSSGARGWARADMSSSGMRPASISSRSFGCKSNTWASRKIALSDGKPRCLFRIRLKNAGETPARSAN